MWYGIKYLFGEVIGDLLQHLSVVGSLCFTWDLQNLLSTQGKTNIVKILGNWRDEEKLKDCREFNLGGKAIRDNLSVFKSTECYLLKNKVFVLYFNRDQK